MTLENKINNKQTSRRGLFATVTSLALASLLSYSGCASNAASKPSNYTNNQEISRTIYDSDSDMAKPKYDLNKTPYENTIIALGKKRLERLSEEETTSLKKVSEDEAKIIFDAYTDTETLTRIFIDSSNKQIYDDPSILSLERLEKISEISPYIPAEAIKSLKNNSKSAASLTKADRLMIAMSNSFIDELDKKAAKNLIEYHLGN